MVVEKLHSIWQKCMEYWLCKMMLGNYIMKVVYLLKWFQIEPLKFQVCHTKAAGEHLVRICGMYCIRMKTLGLFKFSFIYTTWKPLALDGFPGPKLPGVLARSGTMERLSTGRLLCLLSRLCVGTRRGWVSAFRKPLIPIAFWQLQSLRPRRNPLRKSLAWHGGQGPVPGGREPACSAATLLLPPLPRPAPGSPSDLQTHPALLRGTANESFSTGRNWAGR